MEQDAGGAYTWSSLYALGILEIWHMEIRYIGNIGNLHVRYLGSIGHGYSVRNLTKKRVNLLGRHSTLSMRDRTQIIFK